MRNNDAAPSARLPLLFHPSIQQIVFMQLYLQLPTLTTDLDHFKYIFFTFTPGERFSKIVLG